MGTRARVIPSLCRSMALPGSVIGCFPPTSADERILECVSWVPLVRIRPADGTPLVAGPDDPGGLAWLWRQAFAIGATVWLARMVRMALRRLSGGIASRMRPSLDRPRLGASRLLALAMLLVLCSTLIGVEGTSAGSPYRIGHIKLADVCANGLPWTGHAPLKFPARRPRDRNGVPMIRVGGRLYYRPGALAINGMKRIDAYLDRGDERQLTQALEQARRLRIMSLRRRHASWLPFWYDYLPAGQRAPWFNAMVQGLALSFYVRLHTVTGDAIHLEAAHEVFKSFRRLGQRSRPWVAYVDRAGYLWLEHYPLRRPDHVLNAHLHAIFGLYEYWQVTRSLAARKVLKGAITTMKRQAYRYRRPGGLSIYGLSSRTRHTKYHEIHVWQLRLLAKVAGDSSFARLADALASDVRPVGEVPGRPAQQGSNVVGPRCRPPSLPDPP